MSDKVKHIAIAGNIGAGKSTLTSLLAKAFNWEPHYEDVGNRTVIQDRTIYEDAYIFAPNLHAMGLMSTRDFENYLSLFKTIESQIKSPDLMIYLRASIPTLVNQIQKRGREYEDNLRLDYLRKLNEFYEEWVKGYDKGQLLIIDVDNCNFADSQEDLSEVVQRVSAELHGLF
jgi:deoxyadenosine/deoxycytidine kinase